MKKNVLIIPVILSVTVLLFWLNCIPFHQEKTASTEFNVLDGSGSSRLIVSCTIVINGSTYDGNGQTIIPAPGAFPSPQNEMSMPIFKISNGTLKNVTIGPPTSNDSIHLWGNCSVSGIIMPEVVNGVIKVKGAGTDSITDITANLTTNNLFGINNVCTVNLKNINGNGMQKMIRQLGGSTWKCTVYIDTANLTGVVECIGRTDSATTIFYYKNITCNLPQSQWWYTGTNAELY